MRRSLAALSVLIFANLAFAAGESDPKQVGPGRLEGRAMILQSSRTLTDADRAELANEGIFVRHALTDGRYLARVSDRATLTDSRVAAIAPLTAEMKIQRSALRETSRGKTWAELNVIFHDDVTFDDARQALLASGAALADPFATRFAPSHRIEVKIAPASLDAVAADERVLMVAGPRRMRVQSDNATTAELSHVTELYSAPYNLSGEGVTVSLFELAEAQSTHTEFGGRLTTHATGGGGSDKSHATHVSGTIGASGVNPGAKGMAPKVQIHQFCVTCGNGGLKYLEQKEDDLAPLGVVADNNSWGYVLGWSSEDGVPVWNDADIYYGAYDLIVAAPLDEISNDKNVLFVHSAGNDADPPSFSEFSQHRHVDENGDTITTKLFCYSVSGNGSDCPATCTGGCETTKHHDTLPFDTIGVTASAKNVVTVGATLTQGTIVGFSSRGPAKDGRVKPDVVARGFSVFSTIPTNAYGRSSGTSMSSPAVTGIAALLTEQWRKTFAGATPKPAQLKALLIAGADDLGNPGPDYTYGFGLVNAKNSVDAILADEGKGQRIRTFNVAHGQTIEVPVVVSQAQKLRVVLQWADKPIIFVEGQSDIAAKALVNNLDVKVIDGSGNTTNAYVLDKNNPNANATTGLNTIDNTEVVEIANAAAGAYRIVVTGTNVPEGPQEAVLVSSARAASPCLDLQENNDSAASAYGNLVPGQQVNAGLCSSTDVDFFKFVVTKTGPVSVTVTTGDTAVRVTMTGTGISRTQDVPANTTAVVSADATTVPNAVTLKFEPIGSVGAEPQYKFTPQFGETNQPRRRSVRK